jgi:membrane associated rhomboid family serine protease
VQRYAGLTLLTSFFIHGSWLHLLVNLYVLLVFGDNVEEYLGAGRYLALLAVATVAGGLAHVALDPRSVVPVIGASGGISGVVAYYVLRFPQARLGLMYVYRWFRIRAYAFGLIWVLLQIIAAREQIAGIGDVSALAHLGGAAVGVWFWAIWTRS